jgi:hypothetical protein
MVSVVNGAFACASTRYGRSDHDDTRFVPTWRITDIRGVYWNRAQVPVQTPPATTITSDTACVTERALIRFADTEKAAKPGEIVLVDRHGQAMTKRRRTRRSAVILGASAALWIYMAFTLDAATLLTGIPVGLAASGAFLVWRRYRVVPFLRVHSLMLTGDIDGAESLLATAPRPRAGIGARLRAHVEGWLAYARGRYDDAITCFARGMALTPRTNVQYLMFQCGLGSSLARSGKLDDARKVRSTMKPPAKPAAPLELGVIGVDLTIAFAAKDAAGFDETTLDRWVRLALETNNSGGVLAILAWVVATRGDDDLADHLAREAVDRFSWCPLSSWPELDGWIRARLAP